MSHPLTEGRFGFAKVDGDVEYPTACYTDKFSLGLPYLIMQASQDVAGRLRMVILHKLHIQFDVVPENSRVPCLQEEAALVREHPRLQEQDIWVIGPNYPHVRNCCSSSTNRSRYRPYSFFASVLASLATCSMSMKPNR